MKCKSGMQCERGSGTLDRTKVGRGSVVKVCHKRKKHKSNMLVSQWFWLSWLCLRVERTDRPFERGENEMFGIKVEGIPFHLAAVMRRYFGFIAP